MRPIKIKGNLIPRALGLLIGGASGITLWPFIFIRADCWGNRALHQHEEIHFAQYNELWIVGFPLVYLWDFCHGMLKCQGVTYAYHRIRLEQEAYAKAEQWGYLSGRRRFAWTAYAV